MDSLLASANAVTVVVKNQGLSAVNDAFWVEAYLNPTTAPTGPNQEWHTLGGQGLVWGITSLPVAAGESITLTLSSASFVANQSSPLPLNLTVGSSIYTQVDSANTGVATGAVLEVDETNNILGPVLSTGSVSLAPVAGSGGLVEGLPKRVGR